MFCGHLQRVRPRIRAEGKTATTIALDGALAGIVGAADTLTPEAKVVIIALTGAVTMLWAFWFSLQSALGLAFLGRVPLVSHLEMQ